MSTSVHAQQIQRDKANFPLQDRAAGHGPEEWPLQSPSRALAHAVQQMIAELENDTFLAEPERLRERLEALDRMDACFPFATQPAAASERFGHELGQRARAIHDRLQSANKTVYANIRRQIQSGLRPSSLLRASNAVDAKTAHGVGYDYLDELVGGVLALEEPLDEPINTHIDRGIDRDSEMLFFQPTPARHIFNLMELTALAAGDTLVDLGSGLGHVPMLASICTEARCVGIEWQSTYIESARQSARSLKLDRVDFTHADARQADLSTGTVFYLYTPFMGSVLSAVLSRLRQEASTRPIRICSYGPCTPFVAQETWLTATTPPDQSPVQDRITVFCSRAEKASAYSRT